VWQIVAHVGGRAAMMFIKNNDTNMLKEWEFGPEKSIALRQFV
jgi:hypothetical protein